MKLIIVLFALSFGDSHIGIFRSNITSCGSVEVNIGHSSSDRIRIATMNTLNPNLSCDESTIVDQRIVSMESLSLASICQ